MENFLAVLQNYVESNNLLAYPLVFLAGILISFTPCLYPLIPITIGFIGAAGTNSIKRNFLLSLSYVLGVSSIYTLLGAVASLTGFFLGGILSSGWIFVFLGVVFISLGAGALGFYNIPFLGFRKSRLAKPVNYAGSFLVGFLSGLAVGPCIVPALGVILAYVATKKNVIFGMSLLFTFALGMTTLLLFLGTFSSLIKKMPRAGKFNMVVEKVFGGILLIAGLYFLIVAWGKF